MASYGAPEADDCGIALRRGLDRTLFDPVRRDRGWFERRFGLPPGRLVVADSQRIHAMLFGEVAPGHGVGSRTKRIAVFSVGVEGVPAIHVEEALWVFAEAIAAA